MIHITVSPDIKSICPDFVGAAIEANILNSPYSSTLWNEIMAFKEKYRETYTLESVKLMPPIQATRLVYKRCGKDPSRYRPSGEALVRRMLNGHELYQINTAVDLINLASVAYGYSIGGFDRNKIHGDELTLGIGKAGEPYKGIGRGLLNIEGLPVYRDKTGGIGTPTSDHERTKISIETNCVLIIINGYDGNSDSVEACATFIRQLLKKHADSDGGEMFLFK